MSWIAELQAMQYPVAYYQNNIPFYHYTGTFLHQPVDVISPLSMYDMFVEQVVKVELATDSMFDPGGIIRKQIRNKIYDKLTSQDVISRITPRDSTNSQVTSWLLGGIADDEQNPDGNNIVIEDIAIQNANPELGIPEDTLIIGYRGPRNVFVPRAPADWPTPGRARCLGAAGCLSA